jgi:hypothetical protein
LCAASLLADAERKPHSLHECVAAAAEASSADKDDDEDEDEDEDADVDADADADADKNADEGSCALINAARANWTEAARDDESADETDDDDDDAPESIRPACASSLTN